jgi:hypothetical protein
VGIGIDNHGWLLNIELLINRLQYRLSAALPQSNLKRLKLKGKDSRKICASRKNSQT